MDSVTGEQSRTLSLFMYKEDSLRNVC